MTHALFTRRVLAGWLLSLGILGMLLATAAGCAQDRSSATTRPASWSDQALRDPANFNPKMDQPDISGGGLLDFDRKSMGRDLDNVFNP